MLGAVSTACRCSARTKAGVQCGAFAVQGSAFCWAHSPELAGKRDAARAKGGRARHGRQLAPAGPGDLVLQGLGDVPAVLNLALQDMLCCEPSLARARALGFLAGVAVKVYEVTDLLPRLERLEQLLAGKGDAEGAGVQLQWLG